MEVTPIEAGDIVTGYHKGYWKVLKAGRTVEYQRIDGKQGKSPIIKSCDRAYCKKIDPDALCEQMIFEAYKLRDLLKGSI